MQNYKNKIEAIKIILQQHLLAAERTIESCETDAAEFFAKGRKEECEFLLDFLQEEEVLDFAADTLAEALVNVSPQVQNQAPEQLLSCNWCKRFNPALYRTFESWKCVHCQETNVNCK